jgi:asparagine synthase (glutamine-hydrolysing)
MCGIAGSYSFPGARPAPHDVVLKLTRLLTHRGPDEEGFFKDEEGRVSLGVRRLSIVDLASGQQPQASEDGRTVVVFNGEIYNHVELRAELVGHGHAFQTDHSDTEVIVHGYEQWGNDCFRRLRGMFAVALWDARRDRLVLARDPVGKKPLYWCRRDGAIIFASEATPLALALGFDRLSLNSVGDVLRWGYTRESIWADVRTLPPATALVSESGEMRLIRYWTPTDSGRREVNYEDAVDRVGELLGTAVARRLRADVPVGLFLSGGLDSSLLAALALSGRVRELNTFSVVFRGDREDESSSSSLVARALGCRHETIDGDAVDEALLRAAIVAADEPLADPAIVPTLLLADLASRRMKVVMSGEGADELFLGYDEYRWLWRLERISTALARLPLDVRPSFRSRRLRYFAAATTCGTLRAAVAERLSPSELSRLGFAASARDGDLPPTNRLAEGARFDFERFLPGDLLMKVDKVTMARSLEARAPYLDVDLVEFVLGLSLADRIGSRLLPRPKSLLRDVALNYLPAEILERRKHPFLTPTDAWIRTTPNAVSAATSALRRVGLQIPQRVLLSGGRVNRVALGRRQRWTLFVLGIWLDEHPSARLVGA